MYVGIFSREIFLKKNRRNLQFFGFFCYPLGKKSLFFLQHYDKRAGNGMGGLFSP
jgi:hypothetical protein